MSVEIVDPQGVAVRFDGNAFLLEEARIYRIRTRDAQGVWLGEQRLIEAAPGQYQVDLGHYVGGLVLRIETTDGRDVQHRLRVHPRAEKLPPELWVRLLEELEEGLAGASVGVMGPTHGAVDTNGVPAPLLVSALLPLVPALLAALQAVIDGPRRIDREHLLERKLHECRRIDSSTISWIGRHPEVGRWLDGWKAAELVDRPPLVPIHAPIVTLDHPVNRYVAWLTRQVIDRLVEVANELDRIPGKLDEPMWCRARAERARLAALRLRRLRDRSWLNGLRPEPASEAAFLVVADDPTYARFQRIARRFCAPAFRLQESEADPGAAVRPSFSIYELWCFFALQRHLAAVLPGWNWSGVNLAHLLTLTCSGSGAVFVAERDGRRLQLEFNPTFKSWYCRVDDTRHSLSSERRPDFVITFDDGLHQGRWVVLDAKYRAGRENLAKALASVHIYRDALVDPARGGKCSGAMLLVPSRCDVAEWFDPAWQRQQRMGIAALAPGSDARTVTAWVCEMIGLALPAARAASDGRPLAAP